MAITGHWFGPDSSTRHEANLQFLGDRYQLRVNGELLRQGNGSEVNVSDRLGDMPRRLRWEDGAAFETADNAAIDQWLSEHNHSSARSLRIHNLERSWKWAAVGAVLTVFFGLSAFFWGLPALSTKVAENLPVSIQESISRQSMATLDRILFDDTTVNDADQAEIKERFAGMVAALPSNEYTFKLHFRKMKDIPNAMALPGGDIVVTDALIELVENSDELDSVLLHEMGHVVERHGMKHAVQASAISVIVALAFGDLSGIGELGVGVPVFLLQSSYSRRRESEADAFAFARMGELGKDPRHFASVITRLGRADDEVVTEEADDGERQPAYFSSHPHAAERAIKALEASRELGFPQP